MTPCVGWRLRGRHSRTAESAAGGTSSPSESGLAGARSSPRSCWAECGLCGIGLRCCRGTNQWHGLLGGRLRLC
jgi:hypothetical protein